MKTIKHHSSRQLTLLAMAVLTAIGQAHAQQTAEVDELINPSSAIVIGDRKSVV